MLRPSRRAVIIAASFALGLASVAPAAHASRTDSDPDTDEEGGGLLGLIDITDLLGELPLLDELGVPGLDGLGLPTLEGIPTIEGIGLPTLEGVELGEVLPLDGGIGDLGVPLPPGTLTGLDLNILISVGLSGTVTFL